MSGGRYGAVGALRTRLRRVAFFFISCSTVKTPPFICLNRASHLLTGEVGQILRLASSHGRAESCRRNLACLDP